MLIPNSPEGLGIAAVARSAGGVISSSEGRVTGALAVAADPNATAGQILEAQFVMADYSLRVSAATNLFNSYQQAIRGVAQNIN